MVDSSVVVKVDKAHLYALTFKNAWIILVGEQEKGTLQNSVHDSVFL